MDKQPTPLAEWPEELRRRYEKWASLTIELGIKLPSKLTISQWCEAHGNVVRGTWEYRRRKGRTPATVPEGDHLRSIPLAEWIRHDMQEKMENQTGDAVLSPFSDVLEIARGSELPGDYAAMLERALEATMPGAGDVLDDVARRELSALAWLEHNPHRMNPQQRGKLKLAIAETVRRAVERYQRRNTKQ